MTVFNAQDTLRAAVDSILAQNLTNWELILIDDGSLDNSAFICDEYSAKDNRIRVIHKKNAGVAAARQDGLNASLGKYVIHADSDDTMESQALLELYSVALREDADVVLCDYYLVNGNVKTYISQQPTKISDNDKIIKDFSCKLIGTLWNKLIRRECILKYNLNFIPGINYSEDLLFCYKLFLKPVKCAYLQKAFYYYTMRDISITNTVSRENINTRLKAWKEMQLILDRPCFRVNVQLFIFYITIGAVKSGLYRKEEIIEMFRNCPLRIGLKYGKGKKQKVFALLMSLGLTSTALRLFKNE